MGATFRTSNPCDTPCEMLTLCSIGLGPPSAPLPKSGGGALSPAAIPVMLGASASGAAAADWSAGAVPPLTTRAATAGVTGPSLETGLTEPGFVESGLVES